MSSHHEFFIGNILNDDEFCEKYKRLINPDVLPTGKLRDLYAIVKEVGNSFVDILTKDKSIVAYAMDLSNKAMKHKITMKEYGKMH